MARLTVFDDILVKAIRKGIAPAKTKAAKEWFRKKSRETAITGQKLLSEVKKDREQRLKPKITIGECYMFFYDPKHKKTLPYYDQFPVIFPIESTTPDTFLGINLHYLPPKYRAVLMDSLYTISTDKRYDEKTKLVVSYRLLKAAAKFKWFKPCVKQYLLGHVRSPFIKIFSSEWDIGLFLPTEQFQKASKAKIWADSVKKVNSMKPTKLSTKPAKSVAPKAVKRASPKPAAKAPSQGPKAPKKSKPWRWPRKKP